MPFILLLLIVAVLAVDRFLPTGLKEVMYAISLLIKSGIIFILPFIIFSLLFKTMVGMASKATQVILLILVCVVCSNTLSTFLSHFVGEWVYQFHLSLIAPADASGLTPAFQWSFPKWIGNDKAMFAGIILGMVFGRFKPMLGERIARALDRIVDKLLYSIVCLIPIFVLGFVVKLASDGVLYTIFKDYSRILVVIAVAQFSYISFLYLLVNRFDIRKALKAVANILPAAMTGFSTMSSAAAMPLTIAGSEANAEHKDIAGATIPATVNIHLIGDCFAIPIFAYAVMKSFAFPEPTLMAYMTFLFYFVIAKFSVAAVPGGGILVMMPILETYLGFNSEMLSLMTGLYLLFDPVITCANVFGNGAFALIIDKLCGFVQTRRAKY